jgi:hypothetical protein
MRKTLQAAVLILGIAALVGCTTNPALNLGAGTLGGAGAGAAIGCLATIPIGCVPGAAVGSAIGAGVGAAGGLASTGFVNGKESGQSMGFLGKD